MVLRAPAERVPRQGALFLILDEDMLVQGVSRGAEAVLLVDEPEAVNVPLGELLRPGEINGSWRELARLVSLALTAKPALAAVELRTAGHPILWFTGWVSSCGPPPAALLLLNPLMVAGADA